MELALIKFVSTIVNGWEGKEEVLSIMLDLSQAFDMLDHTILLL